MPVVISLLRGVNVGGHNRIKMDQLRALYESLGLESPLTFIQSGNVVFRTRERSLPKLATRIEDAIEQRFGFRPSVILRTTSELRAVVTTNPFSGREDIEPGRLLVTFLSTDPGEPAREKARAIPAHPEEVRMDGRELFVYFPIGIGRSKLSMASFEKALRTPGTGRNWNSVLKLLRMAEELEAAR